VSEVIRRSLNEAMQFEAYLNDCVNRAMEAVEFEEIEAKSEEISSKIIKEAVLDAGCRSMTLQAIQYGIQGTN